MASDTTTLSLDRYAPDAKALVSGAQQLADERQHREVEPLHFLVRGLERDAGVREVFKSAKIDVVELQRAATRALDGLPPAKEPAYLRSRMLDFLERAEREAKRESHEAVGAAHLLNALSQEIRGPAGEVLGSFGVAPGSLRPHVGALDKVPRVVEATASAGGPNHTYDLLEAARQQLLEPAIGRDRELRRLLTILERRHKSHPLLVGEPGVGKSAIVGALARRIAGGDVPTSLANVELLELELGSLVAGVRLRGEIDERLRKLLKDLGSRKPTTVLVIRNLEQLFGSAMGASTVAEVLKTPLERGDLRLLATTTPEGLNRIKDKDSALIRLLTPLPIDEPNVDDAIEITRGSAGRFEEHHGIQIGESAIVAAVRLAKRYVQERFLPDSALDLLDEAAAGKRVELDGVPVEVDEAFRRLESLEAQRSSLDHADDDASRKALGAIEAELAELEPRVAELRRDVESRRGAVAAMRALQKELQAAQASRDTAREKKEFARLGELEHVTIPDLEGRLAKAEEAVRTSGGDGSSPVLMEADVAATLAIRTGILVDKMLEEEAEKLLRMESRLEQRVVGQDEGLKAVARAVRRSRVGLRDAGKPIGSFLFLGPSGVGKTELAKALAEFLFDDEQALTRLDMSEFMERHMAARLIGAPVGYADSEQGGFLTEAVRRRPYSVLLFDEVEKAHGDVFNLLLQVLDDGRLTDGRGRLADFSNAVIIMTSNIGSERILESDAKLFETDEGREALRDVLVTELGKFFRPEFLNRVDDVIVFRPLTRDHLRAIVDIQLAELSRLLGARDLHLDVDGDARRRLVDLGYEPALGARPLKRVILKELQDPLAEALLTGTHEPGSTVRVRATEGGAFRFETIPTND